MKKNLLFLFALLTLTGVGLYGSFVSGNPGNDDSNALVELASSTKPGDGYEATDLCGYLTGVATSTTSMPVYANADGAPDVKQACADENGYFIAPGSAKSYVYLYNDTVGPYVVDLAYPSANRVVIDQTTGVWSGRGKIVSGPGVATMSATDKTVWFDWVCSPDPTCGGMDPSSLYVTTDTATGATSGIAYNNALGFISFNGMDLELPPVNLDVFVDITSRDGLATTAVDFTNAPLADGYDYWEVSAQFDDGRGNFLTEDDVTITDMGIVPVNGSRVYLNQVENSGDAIYITAENPDFTCADGDAYCAETEGDGSFSANIFVSSASPTSNMLGINDDSDSNLDAFTDRDGCISIYADQFIVDPSLSDCSAIKSEVFYDRSNARNNYKIDYVGIIFSYNSERAVSGDENLSCTTDAGVTECLYKYYIDSSTNAGELSFRPRYQATKFTASYDGSEYDTISTDTTKSMTLNVEADVSDASSYYASIIGIARPFYDIKYQLDADSVFDDPDTTDDTYLIMDSTLPPDGTSECTLRTNTTVDGYGARFASYDADFSLSYGQRLMSATCPIGMVAGATTPDSNVLSNPTVEQWVCDNASAKSSRFAKAPSCYYTGYLSRIDAYADPLAMTILGTINSFIDPSDAFSEEEGVSVLGASDTISLRNKMYAQIVRYALGQDATGGALNSEMEPTSRGLKELLGGRLIYAEGDVIVGGADGFTDKTLVTIGGDVFIEGNITGGRLGVIALRNNGEGGNVYVDPSVTDLYANFFLDGSLFSDSGAVDGETPTWLNDEERLSGLQNQLYINGSVVSKNTVNGVADEDGAYSLGDGTETSDYETAREYDLMYLRQYRLCYPLDEYGVPDTAGTPDVCTDGGALSTTFVSDEPNYSPLIIEYAPADNLPVFKVESGLFN